MRVVFLGLLLMATSVYSYSFDAMTINTKFLWDHLEPHEGKVINSNNAPSQALYMAELDIYANAIKNKKVDFVGLTEIEGCHIAEDLKAALNQQWYVACQEGRDTYTGQDVAILSKFPLDERSIYNHDKSYSVITSGPLKGKKVRPSKVVSAVFYYKGDTVIVTTAHLISRTRDNDLKREAQARAIKAGVEQLKLAFNSKYELIMGDFNDYPDSKTLEILKGNDLISYEDDKDCSYTYRGRCQLIDHILTTPNIGKKNLSTFVIDPALQDDHRAVYMY